MKICQTHNLSGEDLFFKWEAIRFNQGPSQFAIEDLQEVKNRIQRDLAKANAAKKLMRGSLMGRQSRQLVSTPGKSNPRSSLSGPMGTPIRPMVRPQDGFDMSRLEEKVAPIAGPSRVAYVGPPEDEEAAKKRACEFNSVPAQL